VTVPDQRVVTLVSNVKHSVHTARALHDAGLLARYLAPTLLRRPLTVPGFSNTSVVRRLNEARVVPDVQGLPLSRLAAAEAVARGLRRIAADAWSIRASHAVYDVEATLRARRSAVLHFTSGIGAHLARRARRSGSIVVCERRGLHHFAYAIPGAGTWPESAIGRRLEAEYDRADLIVVYSRAAARTFHDAGFTEDRIAVVPLGTDVSQFTPDETQRGALTRVLFVGRQDRQKGFDLFIRLVEQLPREVEVRVIGHPAPSAVEALTRIRPEAVFTGIVGHDALVREYRQATALVLPSRAESWGLVVGEAMACGLPVVVSDACGSADMVVNGRSGFVVPAGDVDALRAAVVSLHEDRGRVLSFAAAAVTDVRAWTWERHAREIVSLYRERVLPMIAR
jgi:glycosyltransferase involved in cell wall biosynthesis